MSKISGGDGTAEKENQERDSVVALDSVVTTAMPATDHGTSDHRNSDSEYWSSLQASLRIDDVFSRLRAWHEWGETRHASPSNYLLHTVGFPRRPPLPDEAELSEMADHDFPPLENRLIDVLDRDGKDGSADGWRYQTCNSSNLEHYLRCKKDIATPRCIHVPLGRGLLQKHFVCIFEEVAEKMDLSTRFYRIKTIKSELEEIFRSRILTFNALQDVPRDTLLWQHLLALSGGDITFPDPPFYQFFDRSNFFWLRAASDLPQPIGQVLNIMPENLTTPKIQKVTFPKQMLTSHANYEGSVTIQDEMTCVTRSDGLLLVFSSGIGDQLRAIKLDVNMIGEGFPAEQYAEFLLCRIIKAFWNPQRLFGTQLNECYVEFVQEMKLRRQGCLRGHESLALVEDHVSCMNEISQILEIKASFSKSIEKILKDMVSPSHCPLVDEFKNILIKNRDQQEELSRMLPEIESSLKVLYVQFFQLKTVEQNEIASHAEPNNQAILLFTVVAVMFLFLSFFTSYFGMNLKGVADTDKHERYFWTVCRSITISIPALTLLFAFKHRLYDATWTNRSYAKASLQAASKGYGHNIAFFR